MEPNIGMGLTLIAQPTDKRQIELKWTVTVIAKGEDFEKVDEQSMSIDLTVDVLCGKKYGFTVLSVEDLMKCNSLVFKVDIKVCNIEDDVRTQNAISYWTKKAEHQREVGSETSDSVQIEERLNLIETRLDSIESKMESNTSMLLTMISKMAEDIAAVRVSQSLMKLQVDRAIDEQSSNEGTERMKFKEWMEDKVKLPQYFELFIESGIEDLKSMMGITMSSF